MSDESETTGKVLEDLRAYAASCDDPVVRSFADRMENAIRHMRVVASAYTPILFTDFGEVHAYIEKKLGRPVWTHEFALASVQDEVRGASKDDFMKFCVG